LSLHKEVYLTIDIFFVSKIPFFITLSRKIDFTSNTHLASRKLEGVYKAFKIIYALHRRRGFKITTVSADGEFEPLAAMIAADPDAPRVNLTSQGEHVPEIERRICVVKERVRALRHSLPFQKIPKIMITNLVLHVTKQLTFFSTKAGVIQTMSPRMIMLGESLDYKKHLSLQFGEYCQVHEQDEPRNSQSPRTAGAIGLGPCGNLQGGYRFMSLQTGKRLTRYAWDAIPMPNTVIARVNLLGKDQPEEITFCDRHGRTIGDVELPGVDPGEDHRGEVVIAPFDGPAEDSDLTTPTDLPMPFAPPKDPFPEPDVGPQEPAPTEEVGTLIEPAPDPVQAPPVVEPTAPDPAALPVQAETPRVRRSTRQRVQAKPAYEPRFSGKKYGVAASRVEEPDVLNPDSHMMFSQLTEDVPLRQLQLS